MTAPRVVDGQPVPDVSRRRMKTLEMVADETMETIISMGCFDFMTLKQKQELRRWLLHVAFTTSREMEWSYRRAIDSALTQTDGLARDPRRYERQKRRSKKERETFRANLAEQSERHRQYAAERAENERALLDSGKLKVMPHLIVKPRAKPTEVCGKCGGQGWFPSVKSRSGRVACVDCKATGRVKSPVDEA